MAGTNGGNGGLRSVQTPNRPARRETAKPPAIPELHILWISEGLSCDGDTVSITAATQPSIEDVVLGAIPGLPKVHLHNKVLAYETGEDVPGRVSKSGGRRARAVRARDRGLDPQREDQRRRLLERVRQRSANRPADDARPLDRRAGAEGAGGGRRWHLRRLRRHPRDGRQPDRRMGLADYLGWDFRSKAGLPDRQRPRLPGAARQLHGDAALAPAAGRGPGADDPARREPAPDLAVRQDRPRRAATAPATTSRPTSRRTTTRPSAS